MIVTGSVAVTPSYPASAAVNVNFSESCTRSSSSPADSVSVCGALQSPVVNVRLLIEASGDPPCSVRSLSPSSLIATVTVPLGSLLNFTVNVWEAPPSSSVREISDNSITGVSVSLIVTASSAVIPSYSASAAVNVSVSESLTRSSSSPADSVSGCGVLQSPVVNVSTEPPVNIRSVPACPVTVTVTSADGASLNATVKLT